MRLIDADELKSKISKKVHTMYDDLAKEFIEHIDLEDDKSIYMHSMEQYVKVKFAYLWIKSELERAETKTFDEHDRQIKNEMIDKCIDKIHEEWGFCNETCYQICKDLESLKEH